MTSDPISIANAFNNHFVNVGPNLARKISCTNRSALHNTQTISSNSIVPDPVTECEIYKVILHLKNFSPGWDVIPISIIISSYSFILKPQVCIFDKSLHQGAVPCELKLAKVIPLYKSGDKDSILNYRPIFLLTSISKIC